MPLFEVAILEKPTKKEAEEVKPERLVFGPAAVIARDAASAAIGAVLGDGSTADRCKVKVDTQRMEVLVRPFV